MQSTTTLWQDNSKNRTITFDVQWQATEQGVQIENMRATNVTLHQENAESRQIGVHTDQGRQHLSSLVDPCAMQNAIAKHQSINGTTTLSTATQLTGQNSQGSYSVAVNQA